MIPRREFITLLGGAAAAWPLAARAQQKDRVRRIGVLMNLAADDPEGQARVAAFLQGLQEAGWAVGRNLRIDIRWGAGDVERIRSYTAELVAFAPDVILASTNQVMVPMQQATRTVPTVFAAVTDPVAGGFAENLARPGGNATGFTSADYGVSAKWLELLKDIAPGLRRAAVLHDAGNPGGLPQFAAIQAVAPSLGVELVPVGLRDPGEMERAVTTFARAANSGLIVTRIAEALIHRKLIITLAAKHRLPAVYPLRLFVADGGLMSYGPDVVDQHRRAAGYVDRILKGEKPAELPVQAPTKYELVINLTKLVRVDTSHRQAGREQGTDDATLVTAAWLKANCGDCEWAQPCDQLDPAGGVVTHRKEQALRQDHHVQAVLRHVNAAIGKLFHLRIPSLLMRARAQATVRVWRNRREHQAHSRSNFRDGCGLPVVTEVGL